MGFISKKSSRDLTTGNTFLVILGYAVPILMGQLLQTLYHSADSIVVGKFVGVTALAAVSCSSDISQLIVGFFTGLSAGGSVLFSKLYGQRKLEDLQTAIHTSFAFSLILGGGLALLGVAVSPLLLQATNCPPEVRQEALQYLRIYLIGIFFTSVYNVLAGVLRAVGDSRSPFLFLLISSTANILLDVLLVAVIPLGVTGAGLATIGSQLLSCGLILTKMYKTEDVYQLSRKKLRIDGKMLLKVIHFGIPAAIQTSIIAFSNLFIQRYLNGFGTSAIAGMGAAKKIDNYVNVIAKSLGLSMATFASQNLGAQKYRRVFRGILVGTVTSIVMVIVMGQLILLKPEFAAGLFTDDAQALDHCIRMMRLIIPFYVVMSVHAVFSNVIRGFGRPTSAMVLAVLGMVFFRQAYLAIAMGRNPVVENIFWSYPMGWMFASAMEVVWFGIISREQWKKARQSPS